MRHRRFIVCALLLAGLTACSGDKARELLETAQLEERQMNVPHAKELYKELIRRYPSSPEAEIAKTRLAELDPRSFIPFAATTG